MKTMNLTPSLERWARLTVHRLIDDAKPLGWALAGVTAVNLLWLAVSRTLAFQGDRYGLWAVFVTLASVVAAASAFRPMHEGRSSTDWLLWPASPLEKYASAVTASVVLVPLGLTAASVALSALLAGLATLVTGQAVGTWLPWSGVRPESAFDLVVGLLVILTGAATFRKHVLFKTGLVAAGALAVLVGVALVVLWAQGGGTFQWTDGGINARWPKGNSLHEPSAETRATLRLLADVWAYGFLPAFCLAFGWSKVGEKEARDEVQ